MAGPFYYRHYIGDYDTATKDFSLLQHGVYRRLLDGYFSLGGLPSDEMKLFRITGALAPDEQEAVRYVVDLQFEVDGDRLVNERCDSELARISKESNIQSAKARKRWGVKAENAAPNPPAKAAAPAAGDATRASVKSQDSKSKSKPKDQPPELPPWIPQHTFDAYLDSRKKKPTAHAIDLLIRKLDDLRKLGHPPKDVLEQSIRNGWVGIFELKDNDRLKAAGNRRQAAEDNNQQVGERWALSELIED